MTIVFIIILSYFIGTIPSSYLIVKLFHKKNILEEGSGNAGALNTLETTGNKLSGAFVLILDLLKGILAAFISFKISNGNNIAYMSGLIWVIIGHNYNLFFGGKGGRGLASAAGSFGALSPFIVFSWLLMWAAGFFVINRNVHIANAIALIGAPILLFSTPGKLIEITHILPVYDILSLKITFTIACIVILLRHIKPLKELAGIKDK